MFKFDELCEALAGPSRADKPLDEPIAGMGLGVEIELIRPPPFTEELSPTRPFCDREDPLASCHEGIDGGRVAAKAGKDGTGEVEDGKLGFRLSKSALRDLSSCCSSAREWLWLSLFFSIIYMTTFVNNKLVSTSKE